MKKFLLMVAATALVLSVASCSIVKNMRNAVNAARSAAADASALVAEQQETPAPVTGDDLKDTSAPEKTQPPAAASVAVPAGNGWPKDIPSYIPAFGYGEFDEDQTVETESRNTLSYILRFNNVTKDQAVEYGKVLKNAGLDVTTTEGSGMYSATGMKMKGYFSVCTIMASWDSNSASCSVMLTISDPDAIKDPLSSLQNHWPKEAPLDIPAFTSGAFDSEQMTRTERKGSLDYSLHYTDVTSQQVKEYGEALKKAGLDVTTTEGTNMCSVTGMKMKGYAASFTISVYWDSVSTSCTVSVTINKAS